MPTIYDVAQRAGVSLSTVSRVLNGKGTVNPIMAEKVKKAAEELQYTPSHIARALASKYTNAIGIVLPNTNMAFASHLLFSFEHMLRKYQKHCVVAFSHDTETSEHDAVSFLLAQGCDGIVVNTIAPAAQHLNNKSKPLVTLDTTGSNLNELSITASLVNVITYAHAFLIGQGHSDIALIYDDSNAENDVIFALFNSTMVLRANNEIASDPLMDLLATGSTFSAVICTSALLAESVSNSAKELGMELPNDLSILVAHAPGAQSSHIYNHAKGAISSVEYSTLEIAKALANKCLTVMYELPPIDSAPLTLTPNIHDYGTVAPFS